MCGVGETANPREEWDDVAVFFFLIHRGPNFGLVVEYGFLVSPAEHAVFMFSWKFKLQFRWASFGEDAGYLTEIVTGYVRFDFLTQLVEVSVGRCVLVSEVTDDSTEIEPVVDCTGA